MATLTKGKIFTNGETVTPQKLHELVDLGTVTGIVNADIAAGAAIADSKLATISSANKVAQSAVTNLTTDLAGKAAATHTHTIANVTGLQTALDGKQASGSYAAASHGHAISDTTGLQTALDGKQASGSYAAASHTHDDRYYTETEIDTKLSGLPVSGHTHTIANVTGLQTALDGKQASGSYAAASHTHTIANVTGLQTALDGKQASGSYAPATGIAQSAVTNLTTDLAGKAASSHTHFDEVLQPGGIYSSASVSGGSVFELSSALNNGSAYGQINFHRGAGVSNNASYATFYQSGGIRGTISPSGASGVAYNTSSDYRLKTNIEPLTAAVARLLQIPVHRFNWLADPAAPKIDGFLAHEAQAIVPESVTGHKDEVDADGKPIHQGIDQSKLVPLLVAAVQELAARVAALEAR